MRVSSVALMFLLASGSALAVRPDKAGCKDHPLFPTAESVVDWVRELRAADTDPWDDAG